MAHALIMLLLYGAIVVAAGILLGYAADEIASTTGLGGMWTGWILLAAATSLPEFVTDVSAVGLHAANLAAGDLFGSSLTNMAILAIVALIPVTPNRQQNERTAGFFNIYLATILTVLAVVFILAHTQISFMRLRPESLSLFLIWLVGTRVLYLRERSDAELYGSTALLSEGASRHWSLLRAAVVFVLGSVMIFATAPRFASSAQQFAAASRLGESFVGTWLLGFSTALPELATSITACRLGAFDLAVANLYGSCAFNMVVFFAMDLASPSASIFTLLDPVLAIPGFLAVALMLLGLAAIASRRHRWSVPDPAGGLLLASYGIAIWIVYAWR